MRITRALSQPGTQLGNLSPQRLNHLRLLSQEYPVRLRELSDEGPQLRILSHKLLI